MYIYIRKLSLYSLACGAWLALGYLQARLLLLLLIAFHFADPNIQKPVELLRENGTTLFNCNKVSSRIEGIHLRFDRNFDYCLAN